MRVRDNPVLRGPGWRLLRRISPQPASETLLSQVLSRLRGKDPMLLQKRPASSLTSLRVSETESLKHPRISCKHRASLEVHITRASKPCKTVAAICTSGLGRLAEGICFCTRVGHPEMPCEEIGRKVGVRIWVPLPCLANIAGQSKRQRAGCLYPLCVCVCVSV